MGYGKMFGTRQEHKKMACGAFVGCCIMAVALNLITVLILLKPFLRLPPFYFQMENKNPIIYNFSNSRSDVYEIEGDIRIRGTSSTIFVASTHNFTSWTTKPYAQKLNTTKIRRVTNFKIKLEATANLPDCSRNLRSVPAIVFSNRGHAENSFHAFADVLFPLFLTSHHFNRTTIFLVTNHHSPWTSKYRPILEHLSEYNVHDIDRENEVLCFSRMIVGLRAPTALFIHPSESRHFPLGNFRKLLRSAYSLDRESVPKTGGKNPPRMLIISRATSRRLMNEREVGNMARSLGFYVEVGNISSNVTSAAESVNSFDVMVGVHGAGLTNLVFLPDNAVVVQITPFGVDVDSMICFGWPAKSTNLRYLEYKVSLNESSLLGKYPVDSEVCRDPGRIRANQNGRFHAIYLDYQDVKVDLDRFRETLLKALELVAT